MKEGILEVALKQLKRKMKALQRGQRGALSMNLQLDWNIQLYAFLKLQLQAERQWKLAEIKREPMESITPQRSRKQLAMLVARSGGWGVWVMKRILKQEVDYVRFGRHPAPKQGRHGKVTSWLSDEGTMLTIREYMSVAGEGKFI